jgi:hypothetical protein
MTKEKYNKPKTKTYHICYLVGKELCTGTNIEAENYIHALVEFQDKHKDKEIVYVTELFGA